MTEKERIFISYSTKDGKACADALREELEAKGFSVWQDLDRARRAGGIGGRRSRMR